MKTRLSEVEKELAATKMQVSDGAALLGAARAAASSKDDQILTLKEEKSVWQAFALVAQKVDPSAMMAMLAAKPGNS